MDEPSEVYYQIYSFLKLSINFFFYRFYRILLGDFYWFAVKFLKNPSKKKFAALNFQKTAFR